MKKIKHSLFLVDFWDHFDSALYGFLAPLMGVLFLDKASALAQALWGYAFLASSVVTYPLGAFLFGLYAGKKGPEKALHVSITGLMVSTILIGVLPLHNTWGPVLLFLGRMGQGIFVSGERTISRLYILHNSTEKEAMKVSGTYQALTMCGILAASFSAYYVLEKGFFLWRCLFVTGGIMTAVSWLLRRGSFGGTARETLPFRKIQWSSLLPIVLAVSVINGFAYIPYALCFQFINAWVPLVSGYTLKGMVYTGSFLMVIDLFLLFVLRPFIAGFSSQHILRLTLVLLALTTTPLLVLVALYPTWTVLIGVRLWWIALGVAHCIPLMVWLRQFCKGPLQYMSLGLGCVIGSGILGHPTTYICLWLYKQTGYAGAPGLYVFCIGALSFLAQHYLIHQKKSAQLCEELPQ